MQILTLEILVENHLGLPLFDLSHRVHAKINLGFSQMVFHLDSSCYYSLCDGITYLHSFLSILLLGAEGSRGGGRTKRMAGRDHRKKPRVDEIEETLDPSKPKRKPRFLLLTRSLHTKESLHLR